MRESETSLNMDGGSLLLLLMSGKLNAVSMEYFKRISNVEVAHTLL